jgi:hypothetical protein
MADTRGRVRGISRILLFFVLVVGLSEFNDTRSCAQSSEDLANVVRSVVSAEREASTQRPPFLYTLIETPDRTKGHE